MHKKDFDYKSYVNIIWALIILVAVLLTLNSKESTKSKYYDKEIEASNIALNAFNTISEYNKNRGVKLIEEDIYLSYLMGSSEITLITTTVGSESSKRTSINPNFAGLFYKMMVEAGVKENDEIVLNISSSFPCLNICFLAACSVMNLKVVVFSTIGSSQYGANDKDFCFFDWMILLNENNIINILPDIVSFGGEYDTGSEFGRSIGYKGDINSINQELEAIKNRCINNGITFYSEEDYETNIEYRLNYIESKLNNVKLCVNVGGNLIGLGVGNASKYDLYGIIKPYYLRNSNTYDSKSSGLLERYLLKGVNCINILNIKGICKEYNMEFDPDTMSDVDGSLDIYFDNKYNKVVPIITLMLSLVILCYSGVVNFKYYRKRVEL